MGNFQSFPLFTYLHSEQNARQFLLKVYTERGETNVEHKSYENTASFMYACLHGIELFESGRKAPLLTQPLLFFYACAHMLKALIMLIDPSYPSSTTQLAHGISTRKKKKKQYTFLHDEVRIQRDGLLPIAAKHLFHRPIQTHTTYSMHQILALIPEMQSLFTYDGEIYVEHVGFTNEHVLHFSEKLLQNHHLSMKGLLHKIKPHIPKVEQVEKREDMYYVRIQQPVNDGSHPFFIELATEKLYFPNRQSLFMVIDELLIYYMVLYNLSMISRYEIEWWGDTISTKTTADYPIIQHFLHIVINKLPTTFHAHMKHMYKDVHPDSFR